MDPKVKKLVERQLADRIDSYNRAGGFTAENYIVATKNKKKYVVKIIRNQPDDYFTKINLLENLFQNKQKKLFVFPTKTDEYNKIIIFPFIDGSVLHGNQILAKYNEPIARTLKQLRKIKPSTDLKSSLELYFNLTEAEAQIKNLLERNKKNGEFYQIVNDILTLKQSILHKYKKDKILVPWIQKSNNFVHGDFHNENILFSKCGINALLDFELAHRGNSAEDVINFVWFAFLNNDLSDSNLKKASRSIRVCKKTMDLKDEDLKNAFKLTFLRFVQSSFLEKSLLEYQEPFYKTLLERDIKKFRELDTNFATISDKLFAEC